MKGFPPCDGVSTKRGTRADFLLLKVATPSDSSSSDRISKTLFPLSRGVGAGDEAAARGTAAIGGGELGVGSTLEPGGDAGDGLEQASAVAVTEPVGEPDWQQGWRRRLPWRHEPPSVLSPTLFFWKCPSPILHQDRPNNKD